MLLCFFISWSGPLGRGTLLPLFIGETKAQDIVEIKEKNGREKKASRITESFIFFMRVPPIL